jgi:hypothetical protein
MLGSLRLQRGDLNLRKISPCNRGAQSFLKRSDLCPKCVALGARVLHFDAQPLDDLLVGSGTRSKARPELRERRLVRGLLITIPVRQFLDDFSDSKQFFVSHSPPPRER